MDAGQHHIVNKKMVRQTKITFQNKQVKQPERKIDTRKHKPYINYRSTQKQVLDRMVTPEYHSDNDAYVS